MSIPKLEFPPFHLPPEAEALRVEVRQFLKETLPSLKTEDRFSSWNTRSSEFSKALGKRGWIGITWPKQYGGSERSFLDRYVVTEELLGNGAPAGAHWVADRQSGPLLLRFGSEEQRQAILPKITAGECYFSIGMSEPDSGSDLAAVRTRAVRRGADWLINGSKIWTSNAHHANYLIALVRTGDAGKDRHAGLTQFVIDMSVPGVTVRPIYNLGGGHEFNEVHFKDYVVPDDMRVGAEGAGWEMVTGELAFERSGPDRFLSDYQLLVELIDRVGAKPDPRQAVEIGRLVSHLAALLRMSTSVAGMLNQGKSPQVEAALVKDVGNVFERELPEMARRLAPVQPSPDDPGDRYSEALANVVLHAPSYTLRGGTREILRGVIARGLGLR